MPSIANDAMRDAIQRHRRSFTAHFSHRLFFVVRFHGFSFLSDGWVSDPSSSQLLAQQLGHAITHSSQSGDTSADAQSITRNSHPHLLHSHSSLLFITPLLYETALDCQTILLRSPKWLQDCVNTMLIVFPLFAANVRK